MIPNSLITLAHIFFVAFTEIESYQILSKTWSKSLSSYNNMVAQNYRNDYRNHIKGKDILFSGDINSPVIVGVAGGSGSGKTTLGTSLLLTFSFL